MMTHREDLDNHMPELLTDTGIDDSLSDDEQRTQPLIDNEHNEEVATTGNASTEAGADESQLSPTARDGELQGSSSGSASSEVGGMSQHEKNGYFHLMRISMLPCQGSAQKFEIALFSRGKGGMTIGKS